MSNFPKIIVTLRSFFQYTAGPYDLFFSTWDEKIRSGPNPRIDQWVCIKHKCKSRGSMFSNEYYADIKIMKTGDMFRYKWKGVRCWRCQTLVSRWHIQKAWMMHVMGKWNE
jgi:hypothetical protein